MYQNKKSIKEKHNLNLDKTKKKRNLKLLTRFLIFYANIEVLRAFSLIFSF